MNTRTHNVAFMRVYLAMSNTRF